ncbi:hypothetical protein NSK_008141 [Nannochloropsis salina CCMP1776]|uniref:Glucose-methanol-choline oxidoreductase N-terminal domain-containing protein n=1 Tax=Nannochloropsis salina CCMP1776 TaxID=1027361 RepID=A0A4D9CMQ4_9STRA|nr:hypothetical protein NSK_008141 [Nannochloropsis salina CCMP1776]|eukprot:TFJ80400.1 hypothetical protein NSK_008141 [Nannochloropsis salina CCMP1776]
MAKDPRKEISFHSRAPKYIIVGAGPAGCALAAALVKGQQGKVVMVERGKEKVHTRFVTKVNDWVKASLRSWNAVQYLSVPHRHLGNRQFVTPRGQGKGGTALINAMQYSRGYRKDYQAWEEWWKMEEIEE